MSMILTHNPNAVERFFIHGGLRIARWASRRWLRRVGSDASLEFTAVESFLMENAGAICALYGFARPNPGAQVPEFRWGAYSAPFFSVADKDQALAACLGEINKSMQRAAADHIDAVQKKRLELTGVA